MAKSPLQHSHHVVPTVTYLKTFGALTVLMLLTIWASYWQLPGGVLVNNIVAMAIACLKAFLVVWVFMGIRWASNLSRLWAVAGFLVMPLMFIMFQDYFMRYQELAPSWDGKPDPSLSRVVDPIGASKQADPNAIGLRPRG